jgi:DNA-binding NarL/FixJ family response regulator
MAWIRKSDPLDDLVRAVRNAVAGKKTIHATDSQFFKRDRFVDVSERQLEILHLIYHGLSNEAIAELLEMQVSTVKTHVSQLFSKLDASSRTEIVFKAIERGLLTTPDSTPPAAAP